MKRAILAALLLTAACANTGAGTPPSGSGDLAGSEWMMLNDSRGTTPPTIAFTTDRASGYAGCNRWFGSVGRTDQALEFGDIGLTRMMCSPPSMVVERAFVTALSDTRGFRIENGELVLYDVGGADTARFRRTN
ncbi:MAG: META domain-containing protein [Hyphomonadaceae bacterium]